MSKRQEQIKQVWFTEEDTAAFNRVAEVLATRGIDVSPDHKRAKSPYSYTKVLRHLLHQADSRQP